MSITTIVVLDTETSDLEIDEGAALMELAHLPLLISDKILSESPDDMSWTVGEGFSSFVEFEGRCSPVARAVHHIRPEQCLPGAPRCLPRDVLIHEMLCAEVPGEMCYAAHNSPFDQKFLTDLTLPWIDTLQCARHMWPDAPKHGNQVLRYWLGVEPRTDLVEGLEAHRALYDIAVTAEVLRVMLREHTPEELIRLSTTPLLLQTCQFKKYRGVPWAEVPKSYLGWIVNTSDIPKDWDQNLEYTVRHYLEA